MKIIEIVHYVMNFIFPKHCVICDKVLPFGTGINNEYLCEDCYNKVDLIKEPMCKKCGAQIKSYDEDLCIRCKNKYVDKKDKSYFEYGFGLCRYNDLLKESLHRIKYESRKEYIEFYGKSIAKVYYQDLNKMNIDCFIPVPIHKERLRVRNYNQAEVLANSISKELLKFNIDIPVDNNIIKRTKNTKVLNKLDNSDRNNELKDAFIVDDKYIVNNNIKNICIIDDIYTTGSTIETMSKLLKENNIEKIYFIVISVVDNL